MTDADRIAFERLLEADPAWTSMRTAADAVGLPEHTLLHCGPPLSGDPVRPTLNSAAVACVFEGWADSLGEAHELIANGTVRFEAAQDWRVATPMAAVVSPSMWLIEMSDLNGDAQPAYAPINGGGTGGDPAPRYGRGTDAAVEWLRFLNVELAAALRDACAQPMAWYPLMDNALLEGDDGHLRHAAAHARLMEVLSDRLGPGFLSTPAGEFTAKWPFFHLNFAMAAVRCVLNAAEGVAGSGLVTALGGNGSDFGLKMSALPDHWFTVAATPPRGKVRAPFGVDSGVGAYGDSAVMEAFGLGAMAHRYAPDMQALHDGFCPSDIFELPEQLLLGVHPRLALSGARCGLSVRQVARAQVTPVVELGIVDREGEAGGLGAGIYRPPLSLFEDAQEALSRSSA